MKTWILAAIAGFVIHGSTQPANIAEWVISNNVILKYLNSKNQCFARTDEGKYIRVDKRVCQ